MQNKIKIDNKNVCYPMPMVLVGTEVNNTQNFFPVAWLTTVNLIPHRILLSHSTVRYSNKGLIENKTFSINIPSTEQLIETDYCGLVSGETVDKSKVFDLFYGELKDAPMIKQCPITMECKLFETIDLKMQTFLFVGEIVNIYTEDKYLTHGVLDVTKTKPFVFTFPDKSYWEIGKYLGKAYNVGNKIKLGLV